MFVYDLDQFVITCKGDGDPVIWKRHNYSMDAEYSYCLMNSKDFYSACFVPKTSIIFYGFGIFKNIKKKNMESNETKDMKFKI
jgi:hypothetical protein